MKPSPKPAKGIKRLSSIGLKASIIARIKEYIKEFGKPRKKKEPMNPNKTNEEKPSHVFLLPFLMKCLPFSPMRLENPSPKARMEIIPREKEVFEEKKSKKRQPIT